MADPKNRRDLAAGLLLILVAREHLWAYLPPELQGIASKGLGALLVLVLLGVVWMQSERCKWLAAALLYGAWCSLQTLLCSLAYMAEPWDVLPGQGICSARIGIDLGALGLLIVAFLAYRLIPVRFDSTTKPE